MVERTGVQPDPLDTPGPGPRKRLRHQPPAMSLAGEFGDQPEIGNLASARPAQVEFEHPHLDPRRIDHRMHGNARIAKDRGERGIVHRQPREPQPARSDPGEQRAITLQRRPLPAQQPQSRRRHRPERRLARHFERGHDRGEHVVRDGDQRHRPPLTTMWRGAAGSSGSPRYCPRSSARTACRGHRRG